MRIAAVLMCWLFSTAVKSQTILVLNETNLEPIPNTQVYSEGAGSSLQTDHRGSFDLSYFGLNDTITFRHQSYVTQTLSYSAIIDGGLKIYLLEKVIEIGDVVISANKWEQDRSEIPNEILTISARQIEFGNPQTSADLLEQSGQVFVQKSQLGGGSPMIRGFAANSVLIMLDGIRMNNAISRGGNLQNVIQIDPNSLEDVEVVFGPGSVIYGSDALGGVMDFHTFDPKFSSEENLLISGHAFTRFATANNEKTGHFRLNIGGQNFSSFSSFTFSDFDDLRTGSNRTDDFPDFGKRLWYVERVGGQDVVRSNNNENVQKFSGYSQWNLIQKLKWRPNSMSDFQYQFHYTTSSDIPRYDRLIEGTSATPRNAEWYYGPQRFMMNAFRWNYYRSNALFDQARVVISLQDFEESRHDRRFGSDILRQRVESLDIVTANLDLDKVVSTDHHLYYGFELTSNQVSSKAKSLNIVTGAIGSASTRYPDGGNTYQSLATYISHKWKFTDRWILSSGVRYSVVKLKSKFENETFYDFPFNEISIKNGALNGTLGLVYNPSSKLKLNALFSTGFRSPNIDDVGKVFDSQPGTVVVPNEDLKPEYTYNFEFGFTRLFSEKVQFNAVVFYTILIDAMARRDFLYDGQDSILYNGVFSKVQSEVNVGEAFIYGFSLNLKADISNHFSFISSVTYSGGEAKEDKVPLRHTTPVFGRTSLSYSAKKVKSEFFVKFSGKRSFGNLPPEEQAKAFLYTSAGSLPWATGNFKVSYQLTSHLQVNCVLENIFDRHYRPYSSGISAPGRNLIFAVKVIF